jgi:hypothetical protein
MGEREKPDTGPERGMNRRDLIRRGAIVGGAAVWATPVMQSLSAPAFAQASPRPGACEACLASQFDPDGPGPAPPVTQHVIFNATPECCACIAAGGGGIAAVVTCAIAGTCSISGFGVGPCP